MSAFGWKREASVTEWLFAEPWEFEFFQAVRLLELLGRDRASTGDGVSPDGEPIRFRSLVTQVFPASEVQSLLASADPRDPVEMTVNLSSLAGAAGPLPAVDSERVIERTWRKDFAIRDFLDIFHHRLLSLLVQTRKAHHPSYTALAPFDGPISHYLYAFFGLAAPELQNRTGVADRSLVFYAGILSQHPRSASGLERLLADYFQVPVQASQLLGQWRRLEPEGWTLLGAKGGNCGLGEGAILGTRVWDQQGRFELNLGPLNLAAFRDFLPCGTGFGPLCQLTRFYAGPELEFGFRLTLQANEVPESRLGQSILGWTSWLRTKPLSHDDSQVRLASRPPAGPISQLPIEKKADGFRSAGAVLRIMATLSQSTLPILVTTPLGDGALIVRNIQGDERISGLFKYTLEMISTENSVGFTQMVGQGITVTLVLADGSDAYLHGICGRFVQAGSDARTTTYYADLHPKLWLLTLSSDCRIFQNLTAPDVIKKVLSDGGITDLTDSLTGTYTQREYCVQYMETAFDFISRLMEDEGIFYFFTHDKGKHTLVLADDSSAHPPVTGHATVRIRPAEAQWAEEGSIQECSVEQQAITAKHQSDDYNFEIPFTDLLASSSTGSAPSVYEYPAGRTAKADVETKTNLALQALEAHKQLLRGAGSCRSFRAGAKFTLAGHSRDGFNVDYVIRQVSFRGDQTTTLTNSFEAQALSTPFRPKRATPRTRIYGSQTAVVVGKAGEEIWTDKYGRIRLHFHWDQLGKKDENDSCWVRVSQGWAGKLWGGMFLPRIGQEVVVSFLDGDPDRPIVTGAVYNAEQTVPYALPDDQTKSTVKSNSSKGGNGFNEVRFEDKAGSEEFYIHAQKDHKAEILNDQTTTIGHDQTITVKNSRTATISEKDETLIVDKGNRTVKVNTGNETHEVKGTRDLTVTGKETHTNKADYVMNVSGNFTLKVSGNIQIEASGSVEIKSGTTFTNQAGTGLTNKAGTELLNQAGTSLTNKAGTTMENNAGISLTNKASASQTVDGGGMLTLKGGMVKIN